MEFVALWLLCGLLALPLFAFWWTSTIPLTTSEVPGMLGVVALGPLGFVICLVLCIGMGLGALWLRVFPTERVILGQRRK